MYEFRLSPEQLNALERKVRRLLEDYETVGYEDVSIDSMAPTVIKFVYSIRDMQNVGKATVRADGGVTISGFPTQVFSEETVQLENIFGEYVVDTTAPQAHQPPQARQAPQAMQPTQPFQLGGAPDVGTLRSMCNKRGMSCRDGRGRFLSKSKLLQLLGKNDSHDRF